MNNNSFTLSFGSDDSERWEQLLDEIDKGNVIPVIGADLLVEPKVSEGNIDNIHNSIINFIASQTGVASSPRTFSQLVYDPGYQAATRFKKEQIYKLVNQVMNNLDAVGISCEPSGLLKSLLATKKFPFVITTSFVPTVEAAMEQVWGEGKVKVLQFNNNPQSSMLMDVGDIRTSADMKQPTVFYMFGKFSGNPYRYVLTDLDMMDFCKSWMSGDGVPRNLTEELKHKYLLVLGNTYSDWLFRFIWYGLRSDTEIMKKDLVVQPSQDLPLRQFMERLETFVQTDPAEVVARIVEGIGQRSKEEASVPAESEYDVFISYSRSDTAIAKTLHEELRSRGFKVWFDNTSIAQGHDWKEAIVAGVRSSHFFVPILSHNIENESLVPHEYRLEWSEAADIAQKLGGRTFIIPFAESGFDFYNPLSKLPQQFLDKNAVWYASARDAAACADVVQREIEEFNLLKMKIQNGNK